MGLRKGILARMSVPCVYRIIPFNRTFGSYYIFEGGLISFFPYWAVPGMTVLLIFNTNKQPCYIGRGNNNLSNGFSSLTIYQ